MSGSALIIFFSYLRLTAFSRVFKVFLSKNLVWWRWNRLPGITPARPESRPEDCKFSKNIRLGLRRSPQGQGYTKVCKVKFFLNWPAGRRGRRTEGAGGNAIRVSSHFLNSRLDWWLTRTDKMANWRPCLARCAVNLPERSAP